jgi:hypothetical protein
MKKQNIKSKKCHNKIINKINQIKKKIKNFNYTNK